MNTVIKALMVLIGVLFFMGYIYVLRQDNIELEASVGRLTAIAEVNANAAATNKERYVELYKRHDTTLRMVNDLTKEISDLKQQQSVREVEVIKYVNKLPEGFEKQCLLMPVPDTVGRVSK